jgi:hypothetical protein
VDGRLSRWGSCTWGSTGGASADGSADSSSSSSSAAKQGPPNALVTQEAKEGTAEQAGNVLLAPAAAAAAASLEAQGRVQAAAAAGPGGRSPRRPLVSPFQLAGNCLAS